MKDLRILGAGPGWLAVDKPSGMSVHNDPESRSDALSIATQLVTADRDLRSACGWHQGSRLSPAHRLDRETSGILLLATDRDSAASLQSAFAQRLGASRKVYRVIVRGQLGQPDGQWKFALTDKAEGRKNPAGVAQDRKPCVTQWRRLKNNKYLTELEIDLLTGRQHQIRRHAALAGHFVVGDSRYGEPRHSRTIERLYGISRLLLHASELQLNIIRDNGSKALISVTSPPPPEFALVFADTTYADYADVARTELASTDAGGIDPTETSEATAVTRVKEVIRVKEVTNENLNEESSKGETGGGGC